MGLELSGPEIQGVPTNSSAALSKPQSFHLLPELLLNESAAIPGCFLAFLAGLCIVNNTEMIDHERVCVFFP